MARAMGRLLVLAFLFGGLALPAARAQVKIGTVQFVFGEVKIVSASGQERSPNKGDLVFEGETILTGGLASAQLKMTDNAIIAMRPDSRLKFDTYSFSGREDGSERGLMSLAQGGFRTITGLIGRINKQNYAVRTPTATVGIRGTDHEVIHILPPAPGRVPIGPPGSYDKVNVGAAFIRTEVATVNINRNQVGYAPAPNLPPQVLPRVPEFFRATPTPIRAAQAKPAPEAAPGKPAPEAAPGKPAPEAAPAPAPEPMRTVAVVDNPSQITALATQAVAETTVTTAPTTTTAFATTPTTTTSTTTTTTSTSTTTVIPVTLTSSSGSTLNTTTQTVTTSTGTTVPVTQAAILNPLIASTNYSSRANYLVPVTGGVEHAILKLLQPQANTQYVLDANRNLTEIKSSLYERFGLTYTAQADILSADIKFSGGTAADHYDDEASAGGTAYMGRWQGGQVSVTDLASTGAVAPFTDALGPSSAHWIVFLTPGASFLSPAIGPVNNVQQLIGTTSYSLIASTQPTDAQGNVGMLNSASLSANFTAQTVNAGVNFSFPAAAPTVTLNATASNMPINRAAFESFSGTSVTCSGSGCAPTGYGGQISGAFGGTSTGSVGLKAGLGYGFHAIPASFAANLPYSEFYHGLALFSASAAPTAGVNPTPLGTGLYRTQALYTVNGSGGATFLANNRSTSNLSSKALTLDAGGNLVHVLGGAWNVFDRGTQTQCLLGTPCLFPTTTPNDSPTIFSMANGTLGTSGLVFNALGDLSGTGQTESFSNAFGGRFGRYQGGLVNPSSIISSSSGSSSITNALASLGSNSVVWTMREVPAAIPLSGSARYLPVAATAPVDSFGNVGRLNFASLDVNFTAQTVDPSVAISINNQNLAAGTSGVPINSNFGFDVSSSPTVNATLTPMPPKPLRVECTGTNCAPPPVGGSGSGYGARIIGGFTGDGTAGGAGFRYTFDTRYEPTLAPGSGITGAAPAGRIANDYITGAVGLAKSALPVASPGGGSTVASTFFWWPGSTTLIFGSNDQRASPLLEAAAGGVTNDASGNLTSVADFDPSITNPQFQTLGGTLSPAGLTTTSNGISFGRYDAAHAAAATAGPGTALTMSGNLSGIGQFGPPSTTPAINLLGAYQWIKGPEVYPFYLSSALAGTATYTAVNTAQSVPTDQNAVTGTLNSATLSVDFNKQSVNAAVNVSEPAANGSLARTWTATATGLALSGDGQFNAFNSSGSNPLAHRNLSVTLTTPGTFTSSAFGSIEGSLAGTGVNGAILAYNLAGFDSNNLGSHEHVNGVVAFSGTQQNVMTPYVLRLASVGKVAGFEAATGALSTTPAGAIEDKFLAFVHGQALDPSRIKYNSLGQPIEFDGVAPIVSVNGTCPTQCTVNEIPVRVSYNGAGSAATSILPAIPSFSSPASVVDFGTDAATGVMWGRYASGNVAIVDRITGSPIGVINAGNTRHFIMGSAQSGPPVLPVSGTFNYTLVGNTNPTDSSGNVGTLNSASLTANFSAQTVTTSVNATVGAINWTATTPTAVPIQKGTFFEAQKPLSGTGTLNVGCSGGSCNPASVAGRIVGGFAGTTGQGAGIAYSLNTGGVSGTTMGGVAAFKR